MIVASQLVLKTHRNFGCAFSLAVLDKLTTTRRLKFNLFGFPLPPVSPPVGDTSLTHVMRLAAHSTTSPTPSTMGQLFIITVYMGLFRTIWFLNTK
jgi:hypothetical protein